MRRMSLPWSVPRVGGRCYAPIHRVGSESGSVLHNELCVVRHLRLRARYRTFASWDSALPGATKDHSSSRLRALLSRSRTIYNYCARLPTWVTLRLGFVLRSLI